jgi:uncharacterized protein YndB with AHSA1/START domain
MEKVLLTETLQLSRFYPVSPDKVWRAWIDPLALRVWFGQADFPDWSAEMDVRPGGRYRLLMREPGGSRYTVQGIYRDVLAPSRLVFTWEQRGGPFDGEGLIRVELNATPGGTELRFSLEPVFDPRAPDAWRGDFKRLGRLLQSD